MGDARCTYDIILGEFSIQCVPGPHPIHGVALEGCVSCPKRRNCIMSRVRVLHINYALLHCNPRDSKCWRDMNFVCFVFRLRSVGQLCPSSNSSKVDSFTSKMCHQFSIRHRMLVNLNWLRWVSDWVKTKWLLSYVIIRLDRNRA